VQPTLRHDAKGIVHAQNKYVGSEKSHPKPEIEIGSQKGGENEEKESREQKSGSRGGAVGRDLASVIHGGGDRPLGHHLNPHRFKLYCYMMPFLGRTP
jgi:hypothetical protein